jgi:imidazolonepropionase
MPALLVRGARQLLTLRGFHGPRRGQQLHDLGIVSDGALLIVDGVIQESGPARRVENLALARQATEVDAAGKVVLPAFVDPVAYVSGAAPRGINDSGGLDAELHSEPRSPRTECRIEEWLCRQNRQAPAGKLAFQAALVLREMVRHGTGTVELHNSIGVEESPGAKSLRSNARLDNAPIDVTQALSIGRGGATELQGLEADYVQWLVETLLPRLRRRDLVQGICASLGFAGLDAFQIGQCLSAAGRQGLRLGVDRGPLDAGAALEYALSARAHSLTGLAGLEPPAVESLAGSETLGVLRPVWSFNGWREPEPARALVDAGGLVGLATGWHPVCAPIASMPVAISLACSLLHLTVAEALVAATVNGAAALGLLGQCGTLEPGKQGDFLILSVSDYRDLSIAFGVDPVDVVVKRGTVVWQKSAVTWPCVS